LNSEYYIKQAIWPDNSETLRKLRVTVFVIEQGVSPKIEWDGRDQHCQHVIAYSLADEPIATGRILPSGHIGRIAVLPKWRGKGVGKAILDALVTIALADNTEKVYLNSQTHAMEFYRRFDFIAEGPIFMEAGIPHQRMVLVFDK